MHPQREKVTDVKEEEEEGNNDIYFPSFLLLLLSRESPQATRGEGES